MNTGTIYDVIIVGGSYAGLSAAMALGRSLRKVIIIDSGLPCNRQTPYSHNFITQDGKTPKQILELALGQVLNYDTVTFIKDLALRATGINGSFKIETASGSEYSGRKLIFATGIKDLMPAIKGFSDCWGITAIHCPYCHGYEFKHQKTGIMANAERGFHLASLVKNLTDELTIFTNGKNDFTDAQTLQLKSNKIQINDKKIIELVHKKGTIQKVVFDDGSSLNLDALYASIPFRQHCPIPQQLGCELDDMEYLSVDPFQQTSLKGVFACGDSTTQLRSVANSVNSGNIAGAMANKELAEEEFLIPTL
ncbi:MAG: pyridine nucleotide-disulfide oxidoreductase [Pseudozobellia sp.]|nr:pyridine nucleotide-disulfide oxidoreductase [Pseudozobellia sp.]MBG47052.1 pyridine nucleotide-disulfide oxidoreductase [Pseudozobellia sp.]|tara:strand:+ start:3637 stop:4560 length:924 start_codon:yes stop_codon:yes gene_type:complete